MHHFENVGLYDALFVMQDVETRTLWSHITGEGLYGELAGYRMPTSNLLQMNVSQALERAPDMRIAISEQPIDERDVRSRIEDPDAELSPMFSETLGEEDRRRERMELGLGLWSDTARRFYPLESLRERGGAVIDEFDGRPVLVYLDPLTSTPAALYTRTANVNVANRELHLDGGRVLRRGVLYSAQNEALTVERPQQLFTRWYGFSLTFPGPEIYD